MDVDTPRWIDLEGAHNVRDLGGMPTPFGVTRTGVLLRADALHALTLADVRRLVDEVGLRHVVDLRSEGERAERGRGLLGLTTVAYSELAVIDGAQLERRRAARGVAVAAGDDPDAIMATGYAELLEHGRWAFVDALGKLASGGGTPALVHCSAGKDRTGVLVALLLDLARVAREAIVDDYARTSERMAPIVASLQASSAFHDVADQVPAFVFDARPETMRRLLAQLDERWGGAEGYFLANGASTDTVEAWRHRFVAATADRLI